MAWKLTSMRSLSSTGHKQWPAHKLMAMFLGFQTHVCKVNFMMIELTPSLIIVFRVCKRCTCTKGRGCGCCGWSFRNRVEISHLSPGSHMSLCYEGHDSRKTKLVTILVLFKSHKLCSILRDRTEAQPWRREARTGLRADHKSCLQNTHFFLVCCL